MKTATLAAFILMSAAAHSHARSSYVPERRPVIGFNGSRFLFARTGGTETFTFDVARSSFAPGPRLPESFYPAAILCQGNSCLIGGRTGLLEVKEGSISKVPGEIAGVNFIEQCGGSTWIATDKSVFELDRLRIKRTFSKKSGLSAQSAYSLFCDGDRVFVGTYVLRGGDMYGTENVDEISIKSGRVRRIQIPPSPNADRLAAPRYVVAMDRRPNESRIRMVTWAFWSIADIFEFEPASGTFTPAKRRRYYFYESLAREYSASHLSILRDYLKFIDLLNQRGMHICQHGAGGNVPGDIREYFALRQEVDPDSVPAHYEKSADWIKKHVAPPPSGAEIHKSVDEAKDRK